MRSLLGHTDPDETLLVLLDLAEADKSEGHEEGYGANLN